jgi:hypothetical protein
MYEECGKRHHDYDLEENFNVTEENIQNKQTTFLHRKIPSQDYLGLIESKINISSVNY